MLSLLILLSALLSSAVKCADLGGVCDVCVCKYKLNVLYINCATKPMSARMEEFMDDEEIKPKYSEIHILMQNMNITELQRYVRVENLNATKFSLDSNKIKALPAYIFSKFDQLIDLNLAHNEIDYIAQESFVGLKQLKVLNLSHNAIKTFDILCLQDNILLETLDLSNNVLFSVSPSISLHFKKIQSINFAHNKIVEFPVAAFESFPDLKFLNLSHNQLKIIPTGAFSTQNQLIELDLSKNRLTEIKSEAFDSENNITKLNLRHNLISEVDFIYQLEVLTELDLSYNSLTKFDKSLNKSSIKVLNVGNNGFTSLDSILQQLPQLEKIDASWNQLNQLPAKLGPNMKELILDDSAVSKLNSGSANQGSLRYLSLSDIPRLESLSGHIFKGIFDTEKNVTCNKLRLTRTGLKSIDKNALKGLNICELDLSGNKLKQLSVDTFDWEKIEKIDLQNNPWHCSCDMQWLLDKVVMKMYANHQDLLQELRCETPEHLKSVRLVHYYNKTEPVLCTKGSDRNLVTMVSSPAMIIVNLILGIIAVALVVTGFYLQRKAIREKRQKKNRRF